MLRIIGHRGSHSPEGGPVENTLEAFEQAIVEGADWIELDVWRTRDDALVIYHDARLPGAERDLAASTAAEVGAHRLADGSTVPTLAEALELARGRVRVNVEIKHGRALTRTLATIRSLGVERMCVLSSFVHRAIFEAADLGSSVERALIMGVDDPSPCLSVRQAWPFWALQRAGARYWHTHARLVGPAHASALAGFGIETQVWTVNTAAQARALSDLGVAGVFTDHPGALRRALEED
jgi:glycerophosphoryl diester phosphodiesterase